MFYLSIILCFRKKIWNILNTSWAINWDELHGAMDNALSSTPTFRVQFPARPLLMLWILCITHRINSTSFGWDVKPRSIVYNLEGTSVVKRTVNSHSILHFYQWGLTGKYHWCKTITWHNVSIMVPIMIVHIILASCVMSKSPRRWTGGRAFVRRCTLY